MHLSTDIWQEQLAKAASLTTYTPECRRCVRQQMRRRSWGRRCLMQQVRRHLHDAVQGVKCEAGERAQRVLLVVLVVYVVQRPAHRLTL